MTKHAASSTACHGRGLVQSLYIYSLNIEASRQRVHPACWKKMYSRVYCVSMCPECDQWWIAMSLSCICVHQMCYGNSCCAYSWLQKDLGCQAGDLPWEEMARLSIITQLWEIGQQGQLIVSMETAWTSSCWHPLHTSDSSRSRNCG